MQYLEPMHKFSSKISEVKIYILLVIFYKVYRAKVLNFDLLYYYYYFFLFLFSVLVFSFVL